MKRFAFAVVLGSLVTGALAQSGVIWDNGYTQVVTFNAGLSFLGFLAGDLNESAGRPQRWAAAPFSIPPGGASINRIDCEYFEDPASACLDLRCRVYRRTGFAEPNSTGDLITDFYVGPADNQTIDPRIGSDAGSIHTYTLSTPLALAAGDYFITLYGATPDGDQHLGTDACIAWLCGAEGMQENSEVPVSGTYPFGYMLRSAAWPSPGYQIYAPANVAPGPQMYDQQDTWNESFALYGTGPRVGRKASGTIVWNDLDPSAIPPEDPIFEIRETGTLNVDKYHQPSPPLDSIPPDGSFSLVMPMCFEHNFDISMKYGTWLRKTLTNINTNAGSVSGLTFDMVNGDVDGDNEITLADYGRFGIAFGSTPTDPNWDANADLDQDGEVTLSDYSTLSRNFGQAGDE